MSIPGGLWFHRPRETILAFLGLFLALLPLVITVGCTTVGETGRKQFLLLNPNEEMQLGLTSFQEFKKEVPINSCKFPF